MVLCAYASAAALFLALKRPSAVRAADPFLRGNEPYHSSPRLAGDGVWGQSTKLGASGCTVLEKVGLCKAPDGSTERCSDGPMKRKFACADLDTGAIYEIANDVEEIAKGGRNSVFAFDDDDAKAKLLSSGVDDFIGDANLDPATGRIFFVKGKFGKSKSIWGGRGKDQQGRRLQQTGNRNVVVLNVVSSEGDTTGFSNAEIADSVFGTLVGMDDEVNLASQYSACSHGQLNFAPQPDSTSRTPNTVTNLKDGVATIYSTRPNYMHDEIVNEAIHKLKRAHGSSGGADYVMLCMPDDKYGIAYAYVDWYLSVYSRGWCTYPGTQMHELGHNLGLSHAGEGTDAYDDRTGVMGYSYDLDDQRRCFSGPKTYKLGWFRNRHVDLTAGTDSFDGTLYGFTQYGATTSSDKMIIKINDPSCSTCLDDNDDDEKPCSICDWYISFNHHGDGFNRDTLEGQDQVILHTKEGKVGQYVDTYLRAKLPAHSSYAMTVYGSDVEVVVGEINAAEGWAEVSVRYPTLAPPTDNPTSAPTTAEPTTAEPTTAEPTTAEPTTAEPTTAEPTTAEPTAAGPTRKLTAVPTTAEPTTAEPTTAEPTTAEPTTAEPTTAEPTTAKPTTAKPTAAGPTRKPSAVPTTAEPTTAEPTTADPTTDKPTPGPTDNPTSAPPTDNPTPAPTDNPTSALPTNNPTPAPTPVSRVFIACGNKNSRNCVNPTLEADVDERHEVRCCSDTDLGDGWRKVRGCSVWSASELNGACFQSENFSFANDACWSVGAQLCTLDELTSNCIQGRGCGKRKTKTMIWSSTPVPASMHQRHIGR